MALGLNGPRGARVYPYRELAKAAGQRTQAAIHEVETPAPFAPHSIVEEGPHGSLVTIHYVADVPAAWAEDAMGR